MMRIRVYSGLFVPSDQLDEDGYLHVEQTITLKQCLQILRCPLWIKLGKLYRVNYQKVPLHTHLKEGDVISFIVPIAGG